MPLLVAVVLAAGCKPESLVSTSQEVEVGRQASQELEQKYPVNKDPQLNALVSDIGQYMAPRSSRTGIQYTFKVLDLKDVNAVSLPGGWVYVYKGLIDSIGGPNNVDKDLLAAVIAHEVGHVAARHHAQMMGRAELYGITIAVATKGKTQQWVNFFANLNLLHYSRKDEFEADKLAIDYTFSSKYNPDGIVQFLKQLQAKSKGEPSKFEAFFRTHPGTADRITKAEEYLVKLRAGG